MTTFATARRLALSTTAALLLSAACIGAAIAPAAAAEPATAGAMTPNAPLTLADWQAAVGTQLDARLSAPATAFTRHDHLIAVVAVSIDAEGRFADARITESSGVRAVDQRVLALAGDLAYPPLPAGYRGRPRTVLMQAYFGQASSPEELTRHEQSVKALASRPAPKHDAVQTAAIPSS
ncbi:energy transducer TonB [Sphingomonas solaris]|uniref:TonB C-terminal domain-containing protein n=1 Tax=Alterirhizorhabdus solaris TaxID=2529389 RepID=A0A558R1X3_9SPHN|nr:TonB family protein [Sphingomonas solaris]TVV73369.1 TonB C-terminal domain-containing protein [Sphingomonas solaris]